VFLGADRAIATISATEGRSRTLPEDDAGHLIGGGLVYLTADVAVDVAGDSYRAVTEPLLRHLQPDTGLQGGAGVRVPKVMESDHGKLGRLGESLKRSRDDARVARDELYDPALVGSGSTKLDHAPFIEWLLRSGGETA
jgi:hypothetical protein